MGRWEERLAGLIAGLGLAWAVHLVTRDFSGWQNMAVPTQPAELMGIALLVWLHARWRRSVKVR